MLSSVVKMVIIRYLSFNQIQINGKWGFINQYGKVVIEPKFTEVSDFKNDAADVKAKNFFRLKSRTIDKTGKFVD